MRKTKLHACNICGKNVDVNNGGCALMMAFCRKDTTNLINVSFCADCYNRFVKEHFEALNEDACMCMDFGEENK